jgi:hypothetical protein
MVPDGVDSVILLAVRAAEQFAGGRDVEGYVALQLGGADDECASGNEHRAATVTGAGVDGGLERGGVDGCAVSLRSEGSDVVDPRSEIVLVGCGLCGCGRVRLALGQASPKKGGGGWQCQLSQAFTPGQGDAFADCIQLVLQGVPLFRLQDQNSIDAAAVSGAG